MSQHQRAAAIVEAERDAEQLARWGAPIDHAEAFPTACQRVLAGIEPYVLASREDVAAGLAELNAADHADGRRRQEARDMERLKADMEQPR
jgi:hypothetical protein